MAEIKNYLKEKEKREQRQVGYKEKIARHKLTSLYRILLACAVFVALVVIIIIQYKRHIYTDYDIIASVEKETVRGAIDVKLGSSILTYSKDGAHCTDVKGGVKWNQTFEIQDVLVAISNDTVAIGEYNGRSIYLANSEKLLGEITTTMPIKAMAVSEAGYVTAVLADTGLVWINTYSMDGRQVREGQARMDDAGYPMAFSLSPNGQLLCVAYVYLDAGVLKTTVTFYNFGEVGENAVDSLVGFYNYTDTLVPYVRYINDDTAFAVGDNRLMIYTGNQVPTSEAEYVLDSEIKSVFYSDRYIGIVFEADTNENHYRLEVYDTVDFRRESFYFDIDYTDIFFDNNTFVIYNDSQCQIMTLNRIEKFNGSFSKTVRLMLPTQSAYRYVLVTEDSVDTIQLK